MWVHTLDGFYSAVEDNNDTSMVAVRARVEGDLVRLIEAAQWPTDIIETFDSDYRYRVIIPKAIFGEYVMTAAEEISYGNFKDAAKKSLPGRERALMGVWSALYELQPEAVHYNHRSNTRRNKKKKVGKR